MQEITNLNIQTPIEWNGQVVITTAQLAEVYGATAKNITNNFQRNKERFVDGKHYFVLQGENLREFKSKTSESGAPLSSSNSMYLWTRRGSSRHCKILGTDRAWEQFDYLEENYFERESVPQLPQNPMELLELHYQAIKQVDNKVNILEHRFDNFEKSLPLLPNEADEVSRAVKKRVVEVLGGKDAPAYKNRGICQKAFKDAYRELKRNFNVSRYKDIKREQKEEAVEIAGKYEPPLFLKNMIEHENNQSTDKV